VKRLWPLILVTILIALPVTCYFHDDLFGPDSQFRVGDAVKVIAEDRVGIVQKVKMIPVAWKSRETVPTYLVWWVNGSKVEMGGKWCSDEELAAVPHPFH